jgi:hypothetical protein
MKIKLRCLFQEEAKPALRKTGLFSNDEIETIGLDLESHSDRFAHFVQATSDTITGTWFNPWMIFTRKELDSAAYFQLDCRKTLEENSWDSAWNDSHVESLELIKTRAGMEILLPNRIAVSRVTPLKPHMVAGVGQFLEEYVVPDPVAAAFSSAALSGYSLRPLYSARTKTVHEAVQQLYSTEIMPPAVLDRMAPPADGGGVRQLGCLTYQHLEQHNLADFNRTAEDWAMGNMPLWVVSAAVRDCFISNKFRGWAFRPVLSKGSDMHRQYEDLWGDLFSKTSLNPLNFF